MDDGDLAFTPALELADLIRRKEVSPVELVELYGTRIEKLNPQLNAYVTPTLDRAMDDARAAEAELGGDDLPPFLGVPISIKDLNDTAGTRTTQGSAAFADRIPDTDDDVVAALKRGGFVILGKTNTPEFGKGPWAPPLAFGPTPNPRDTDRPPGGSRAGAAAVCAGGA